MKGLYFKTIKCLHVSINTKALKLLTGCKRIPNGDMKNFKKGKWEDSLEMGGITTLYPLWKAIFRTTNLIRTTKATPFI